MAFCHLPENLVINMVKKLMPTAKTASKIVVQKTAEVTGDLIGNKIVVNQKRW